VYNSYHFMRLEKQGFSELLVKNDDTGLFINDHAPLRLL
jgi:hypothetical protein